MQHLHARSVTKSLMKLTVQKMAPAGTLSFKLSTIFPTLLIILLYGMTDRIKDLTINKMELHQRKAQLKIIEDSKMIVVVSGALWRVTASMMAIKIARRVYLYKNFKLPRICSSNSNSNWLSQRRFKLCMNRRGRVVLQMGALS